MDTKMAPINSDRAIQLASDCTLAIALQNQENKEK